MTGSNPNKKPLSPFMLGTLYRWQISSVTSMIHRVTGVALTFSFLLIIIWLTGAAAGGTWGAFSNWLITSWIGKIGLLLSLWGLWYHFLNGIRHLAWDMGLGFELNTAKNSGWLVIIGSVVLTLITLFLL